MAILELEGTPYILKPSNPLNSTHMAQALRLRAACDQVVRSKTNINAEIIVEIKFRYTPPQAEGQSRTLKVLNIARSTRGVRMYEV
jgi:hypothetical protein